MEEVQAPVGSLEAYLGRCVLPSRIAVQGRGRAFVLFVVTVEQHHVPVAEADVLCEAVQPARGAVVFWGSVGVELAVSEACGYMVAQAGGDVGRHGDVQSCEDVRGRRGAGDGNGVAVAVVAAGLAAGCEEQVVGHKRAVV